MKGMFHITDDGPGVCKAEKGKCPFQSNPHFETQAEAFEQYESTMHTQTFKTKRKNAVVNEGFSADNYYGNVPPRLVQIEALQDTAEALLEDGNTQLVAACGTGKSYMGRQLMRRMMDEDEESSVAIVLTSSIKLATDTASDFRPDKNGDYDEIMGKYGEDYEVIEIHSDSNSVKKKGSIDTEKVEKQWRDALDAGKRVIIVSTYQSAPIVQKVQEAIGAQAEASLLMNDEAHNILGQKDAPKGKLSEEELEQQNNSGYKSFHNEIPGAIQAKHRLYATATPTVIESADDQPSIVASAEDKLKAMQDRAAAMDKDPKKRMTIYADDEAIVGKVSGTITKQDAVKSKCLSATDYHLRTAAISGSDLGTDGHVDATGQYIDSSKATVRPMTPQTYAAVTATLQSLAADPVAGKNPSHNALAYCGSIAQAEAYRDNFKLVAENLSGGMSLAEAKANVNSEDEVLRTQARMKMLAEESTVLAAHSGTKKEEKAERAKAFTMFSGKAITQKQADAGWSPNKNVLANVDIFSEGVSINEIDTVVIADASKTSERAITQAIGRAARKSPGNDYKNTGHVIIPRAVDAAGKELNGDLVAKAAYGATRFERGVAVSNLRQEEIKEDTKTIFNDYDAAGKAKRTKAMTLVKSHANSPEEYVASQVVESVRKGFISSENKEKKEKYRLASASEKETMIRQEIKDRAESSKAIYKGPQWAIANAEIERNKGRSLRSLRTGGAVASSAIAAGDYASVHKDIRKALSRSNALVQGDTSKTEISTSEKRELLRKNLTYVTAALASPEANANADATVKKINTVITSGIEKGDLASASMVFNKIPMSRATKEARTAAGEKAQAAMEAKVSKLLEMDAGVDKIYEAFGSGDKTSFANFVNTARKNHNSPILDGVSELQERAATRAAESVASGGTGFKVQEGAFTKDGYIASNYLQKIAEAL